MQEKGRVMPSSWHEGVYHAARGCQAASLSLTASRLRGFFSVRAKLTSKQRQPSDPRAKKEPSRACGENESA